ncbi:cell-envelope stress modulator CpxP [Erwinia psidii]|uniref:Stress adaptor protein CpxP n=1 Tax=Erwinia psidii TaxID=69224 RepID=A0A3N6SI07_9GAMM|nr:cell-envelope stress modulator CpxP [Erwinia psidii]MCX8959170.1 stress adaptor protein CpxP [Erwinia psidii]MCX8962212.1 stress adaptor protein CpxP [Erwinia psidii]MCX8966850.1 stress adaptor protein CpxP [Erwinia psidii]RQM37196.1 stress adaptor protein CpxP [Erwinia psidii]
MRIVTAAVVIPTLMIGSSGACGAKVTTADKMHHDDAVSRNMTYIPQSHMFDGIHLSEQQRQQMRDLMQQARHKCSSISINDLEYLHDMIIADKFNEAAYKAQLDSLALKEIDRQVEIARVRNQMYHLLTPTQQDVLNHKHQQRIDEMRKLANMQQASALYEAGSIDSSQ